MACLTDITKSYCVKDYLMLRVVMCVCMYV